MLGHKVDRNLIFFACIFVALSLFSSIANAMIVNVDIPAKYQSITAGQEVFFKVEIQDLETVGRHDIGLQYDLKMGDALITSLKSLKAIETQASFMESIKVPDNSTEGLYMIVVTVNNKETASAAFYVKTPASGGVSVGGSFNDYMIVIVFTVIVIGGLVIYEVDKIRKDLEGGSLVVAKQGNNQNMKR